MPSSSFQPSSYTSSKVEIPAGLILNWQSSAFSGPSARPLIRRPKTACERCRMSKVKCHGDGHHDCGRCTSRGLPCRYSQPATQPSCAAAPASSPRGCSDVKATTREDSEDMQLDLTDHLTEQYGINNADLQQLLDTSTGWSSINAIETAESPSQQQQHNMDWGTLNPGLDWTSGPSPSTGLYVAGSLLGTSSTSSSTSATTPVTTPASEQERSLARLGLFPPITSATAADLSWHNQLASQTCKCRSDLAQLIPNARTALQDGQLDAVFQVTDDVIRRCRGIINCAGCSVNCTDLICIVTVFQEANPCFEYMATGNIDNPITLTIGSYEVSADGKDTEDWRGLLAMQFLRRANELLDSISARGQDMLKELDPNCRLGRVNIEYLQAVVGDSHENLNRIMNAFRKRQTETASLGVNSL